MTKTALIVGTGSGISASVARALADDGYKVALASRKPEHFAELATDIQAHSFAVDAASQPSVSAMFADLDRTFGAPDVVVYNASFRTRGPLVDLVPEDVMRTLEVTAFGAFLVAQEAARRMVARGSGTILFTGASASMKGYAQSAPFAMGKFALRGLAQSMARELQPKGVHIAHFNIDGGVRNAARGRSEATADASDSLLDPDAIAETYLAIIRQPRSAWSTEVELRPWVERF
jgi:NAD(P)-dependent dehydrogenase (short-subunit alcohol dehydrogenase family)